MTTRHIGYLVTLEHELREDDDADIITALKMVRGVVDVRPIDADHGARHAESISARCAVQTAVREAVNEALWPKEKT